MFAAADQILRHVITVATRWTRLLGPARDRYRPEQHYMRGPGPKWHAKQQGGVVASQS
jgi:hypothetical protein